MGYIGSRPKKMQPVKVAAYQERQYVIFSLNVGNGDSNGTGCTGTWRQTYFCDPLLEKNIQKDDS